MNYLITTQSVFENSAQANLGIKPEEMWLMCMVDLNPEKILLIRPYVDSEGVVSNKETSILYHNGNFIIVKESIYHIENIIKSFSNAN